MNASIVGNLRMSVERLKVADQRPKRQAGSGPEGGASTRRFTMFIGTPFPERPLAQVL